MKISNRHFAAAICGAALLSLFACGGSSGGSDTTGSTGTTGGTSTTGTTGLTTGTTGAQGQNRAIEDRDLWQYSYVQTTAFISPSVPIPDEAGFVTLTVGNFAARGRAGSQFDLSYSKEAQFRKNVGDESFTMSMSQSPDGSLSCQGVIGAGMNPHNPQYADLAGQTLPGTLSVGSLGTIRIALDQTVISVGYKCVGQESITVPAGTFQTWKITDDSDHQLIQYSLWFAPAIAGIVKLDLTSRLSFTENHCVALLESFGPGGAPQFQSSYSGHWAGSFVVTGGNPGSAGTMDFSVSLHGRMTGSGFDQGTSSPFQVNGAITNEGVVYANITTGPIRWSGTLALTSNNHLVGTLHGATGGNQQMALDLAPD